MYTRLGKAIAVAIYAVIAWQFLYLGALALMLYITLTGQQQGGAIVAAFAGPFFLYVGAKAMQSLQRAMRTPTF